MNAGFYKKVDGQLLYGPNAIYAPSFTLLITNKDEYSYPVDGWYYFETDTEAYNFFNLTKPEPVEDNNVI